MDSGMLVFFFHAFCFFSIKKKRFSVKHTYSGFLLANPLWFGCLWECKRMEDSGILGLMVHSVFVFSNFPHFHCDLISKVSKVFFKINSCVLFFFFYKALTKFLSWFFFSFLFKKILGKFCRQLWCHIIDIRYMLNQMRFV